MQRKDFSEAKVNETITFDSGYYMTGHITKNIGTHNGKRWVMFLVDGTEREKLVTYAAHRSVVVNECLCCDFGAHDMPCTCNGKSCCHPEKH